MSTNKSEIINLLANNYPNFLKKDLKKIVDIFLEEVKNSLKRSERVELRDFFSLETKLYKARIARNPKTNPPNKEKPMAAAANKIVCQAAPSALINSGSVSKGTSDS